MKKEKLTHREMGVLRELQGPLLSRSWKESYPASLFVVVGVYPIIWFQSPELDFCVTSSGLTGHSANSLNSSAPQQNTHRALLLPQSRQKFNNDVFSRRAVGLGWSMPLICRFVVVQNGLSFLCSKPGVVVLLNNLSVKFCTLQDVWIHISVVCVFFCLFL